LLVAFGLLTAACGDDGGSADAAEGGQTVTLHLGYFANITHLTPLVGVGNGTFAQTLGSDVDLKSSIFGSGTEEIEALFAGAIDAGYIGPNPAVNGYVKSNGEALRIVSGATSGGAALVVKPDIDGPQDLKGKVLATPSLGNTQDVALRAYLIDNGLSADTSGGGDVSIHPQDSSQTLEAFKADTVQGAWVPEPWATRLVVEGGGKVLVDEATLWPEGKFATTELIVSKKFLDAHPDVVKKLIEAQLATEKVITDDPDQAEQIANQEIEKITGKKLAEGVLGPAFENLTFTNDPIASSVQQSAQDAKDVGLLDTVPDLKGLFDLTILNQVLHENGEQPVSGL
jgi:NitT/TauT family transport system substrate-binding protein